MPIRHCQLCGIKVIVDEDKASVFPFYCDLCSTKTQMGMTPAPEGSPPTTPPSVDSPPFPMSTPLSPPSVTEEEAKPLACPSCSAGLPIMAGPKPIKSRCPGCAIELAVLPTGEVKLIEGEDPLKFAKTQEVEIDEGTEGLKAKIRLLMDREKKKTGAQSPVASTATRPASGATRPTTAAPAPGSVSQSPSSPKILIKAPAPSTRPSTTLPPRHPPEKTPVSNPRIEAPPPPPAEPEAPAAPLPPPMGGDADKEEVPSHIPTELRSGFIGIGGGEDSNPTDSRGPVSAPPVSRRSDATPKKLEDMPDLSSGAGEDGGVGAGFLPQSEPDKPSPEEPEETNPPKFAGPKQRRVPLVVAWIFLLVPLSAAFVVPALENEALDGFLNKTNSTVEACARDIAKFLTAQWAEMNKPPEPPPTPVGPSRPEKPKYTEEELQEELVNGYRKYLELLKKFSMDMETEKMASHLSSAKSERGTYDKVRSTFTEQFRKEPPIGPAVRNDLEEAILKLHERINFTELHSRKVSDEGLKRIMQQKVRDMEQAKALLNTDYVGFFTKPFKVPDINDPTPSSGPTKQEHRAQVQNLHDDWKRRQEEVEKQGAFPSSLSKTLLEVSRNKYEEGKREYEAKWGETFSPK
jgi:hypothetical protein